MNELNWFGTAGRFDVWLFVCMWRFIPLGFVRLLYLNGILANYCLEYIRLYAIHGLWRGMFLALFVCMERWELLLI